MKKTTWILECWRTRNNIPCRYRKSFASQEEALKAYNAFDMNNPKHVMAYIFTLTEWIDYPYGRKHSKESSTIYYKDNFGRSH